jgi:hypothetical protein
VEPITSDRKSKDFLGFRVIDTENKELDRFRAGDIVALRRFMSSLGGRGDGLFSRGSDEEVFVEVSHGIWDVTHPSVDELYLCQQMMDVRIKEKELASGEKNGHSAHPALVLHNTSSNHIPIGFYFNSNGMEHADLGATSSGGGPRAHRREWHDTFLPPLGPPVIVPVSIGYGAEVGLQSGVQALWDPSKRMYFFVDHIHQVTFFEDPRPLPDPYPVVERLSLTYGAGKHESTIPRRICHNQGVIKATSERALSRPHGFVLSACGVDGKEGEAGVKGEKGGVGSDGLEAQGYGGYGATGRPGSQGHTGGTGMKGSIGGDAIEASDVVLTISGNSKELRVSGTCEAVAMLGGEKAEEILFVNCRGGDGGRGGQGGDGGTGGVGGLGGNGAIGCIGQASSNGPGGPGGPGGKGGVGGRGGTGGTGGQGGDGGRAANGGVCVFQSADPALLMLVDADCMCGTPGTGGKGGDGGSKGIGGVGGSGGHGGRGGSGGQGTGRDGQQYRYLSGKTGPKGVRGPDGLPGRDGDVGAEGADGVSAKTGGIWWVVRNPQGKALHQAGTRYDVEVTSLKVKAAVDDGIFEPNDEIVVSEVRVANSGGLPLPEGVSFFIPSTNTIKFEPTTFNLPSDRLFPMQAFTIPTTFCGRIFDQPPPNAPGPFISSAEFHSRAELFGRPFEKSFLHQKFVIQYPVKLRYLKCCTHLGRGEISVLEMGIHNISTMPYGSCDRSGGEVIIQLRLDARLIPVLESDSPDSIPYTIIHDPNSRDNTFIHLHTIPPGQTVDIQVKVQMECRAELFDRCHWQASLYLRNKLIEYNFEKIRVTPFYIPRDPPADVLMFTDEAITRKQFVFWQRIFEILQVSVDYWDTTRYNGLSLDSQTNERHQVTWEGKYTGKMILYPNCNLQSLLASDIPRHFHGASYQDSTLRELHSSMLLFLPASEKRSLNTDRFSDMGDLQVLKYLATVEDTLPISDGYDYGGKHFSTPGDHFLSSKPHLKWEKNYLRHLEKEHPTQAPVVLSRSLSIHQIGLFNYGYGRVDVRYLPILRSSKFTVVDGAGGSVINMGSDDVTLAAHASSIPLASNYGQTLLLVLLGLPLFNKIQLLKVNPADSVAPLVFLLPNGDSLSLADLAMITISYEVSDELYSYTGSVESMKQLAYDITEDVGAFANNGQVILQGLKLIKKEVKKRKKKMSNVRLSLALEEIKMHTASIKHTLKHAGVKKTKTGLIPLDYLLCSEQVHHSHQHWTEDDQERWNLVGE